MEEPDVEEGEACDYKDDATIDPDVALSYINEKVQYVLGHLQKDFEGGVSKDSLGAKFGEYGSFLPTYQRSPPAKSQPKTPQMTRIYSTPKLHTNFRVEGAKQNHTAPSEVPPLKTGTVSINKQPLNIPKVACADVSAKVESKPVCPPGQKTLKVRIKVGSDNTAKKNAAIYSGLGLISPSSSTENSHEDSDEMPFNSQRIPDQYPSSILQDMLQECLLLSPLQERLLYLRRKENIARESGPALSLKGWQNDPCRLEDGPLSIPAKVSKGKKTNSAGILEAMGELKCGNGVDFEDNLEYSLKRTTIPSATESKKCFSLEAKLQPLHGLVNETHDSFKGDIRGPVTNGVLVKKRDVNKKLAADKVLTSDFVKEELSESISRNGGKCLQQEAKGSSAGKSRELGVRGSSKDVVPLALREGDNNKLKIVPAPSKLQSDVSKSKKDTSSVSAAHIEQKVSSKVTPQEQDRTKIPPSKNVVSLGVKKKPKGILNSDKSTSNLILKEKKISQKKAHRVRESYDDILDIRSEQQTGNQLGRPSGDRTKGYKLEPNQGKEALNNVCLGTQGVNIEMELGPAAPVVIEEDWVCCDRCQKWRLLPYGMKPEQLPENWLCSMLDWLTGMNRCDISEEETTKALRALPQPFPETQNNFPTEGGRTAPGVSSADVTHFNQNHHHLSSDAMSIRGKQYSSKETSNVGSNSGGMLNASNAIKKPREEMVECRSLVEMKSRVQHLSQSGSLAVERHDAELKEKHPSGGDLKQKKLKSKRLPDHSGYETTKKIKTGAKDVTGKHEENLQKHIGPKLELKERVLVSAKKQRDCTPVSGGSGSLDFKTSEGASQTAKKRKLKDWQDSHNQHLESNIHLYPESKVSLKEEKSDSETRKKKKLRLSKNLEESAIKDGDDKTNKKGTLTRIILSGSRGNSADKSMMKRDQQHRPKVLPKLTMEDIDSLRRDLGSEQFSMGAASSSSKVSDSRRSKRACSQDMKGSPVESVSSSPTRTSKLSPTIRGDMVEGDFENGDFPVVASARKSMVRLGTLEKNRSGASVRSETLGAVSLPDRHESDARCKSAAKAESVKNNHLVNSDRLDTKHLETSSHKSGKPSSLQLSKEKDRSSGFQKLTVKGSGASGGQDLNPKKIQNETQSKQQLALRQSNAKHQVVSDECNLKSNNDEMAIDKKDSRKRPAESRKESLTKTREHEDGEAMQGDCNLQQQSTRDLGSESVTKRVQSHQVESRSGKSRFNPHHAGKEEIQASRILQPISGNLYGSDSDMLEVLNKPGKVVDASHVNSVGNPTPNSGVVGDLTGSSILRKDICGRTAVSTLKEAEELKACADNFKESGFHFECNEANFQAALKFLHAASLMETCGETSKHAEMSPIQVYYTAAKLCEMCSQEYEKRQEMAAAVLAYKCMEVAYMRIVYCKSSSTSRDRYDLQASLQFAPQGESPSSSASDIDNLNNQTVLDKTISRGISSHAGNHLIVARNRPNFVRLLDFTNDVNSAMEALRKSSNAFAVATVILEAAQNKEGIVCVKRVIDFSFQDVEEFIRLVRRASEAISSQGFGSNRD